VSFGRYVTVEFRSASRNVGVDRSHVTIHDWVHSAELQPISTVTENGIAVDEKTIRVNGDDHWPYGAVDLETDEIIHLSLFPATTKEMTR